MIYLLLIAALVLGGCQRTTKTWELVSAGEIAPLKIEESEHHYPACDGVNYPCVKDGNEFFPTTHSDPLKFRPPHSIEDELWYAHTMEVMQEVFDKNEARLEKQEQAEQDERIRKIIREELDKQDIRVPSCLPVPCTTGNLLPAQTSTAPWNFIPGNINILNCDERGCRP